MPHLQNWGVIISSQLLETEVGGLLPDEANCVRTGEENRPKLHYHRSGMTSVQPQQYKRGTGRKTIHLPSLDEIDAVQIFSVTARLPGLLPWNQEIRPDDVLYILDRPDVGSLLLSGVIYDRAKIAAGSIGGAASAPVTFASDHNSAVLVDLSGYGLESVLGLYFNPAAQSLPEFAADFTLASFHPEELGTQGAVAIHAGSGIPICSLQIPMPGVSTIHRVDSLDPVQETVQMKRPIG